MFTLKKKKKKDFGADRIQISTKNKCNYSVQAAYTLTMFKNNNVCMTLHKKKNSSDLLLALKGKEEEAEKEQSS